MSNNVHVINLSAYTQPEIIENSRNSWVEYGEGNNYFNWLIDRYRNSPTSNAAINNIARLTYGRGLYAKDAARKPNEYAAMISTVDAVGLKSVLFDRKLFGSGAFQIIYSKDRKSVKSITHFPMNLLRPAKCNEEGVIEGWYYSDNWEDVKKFEPKFIPCFGTSTEPIEVLVYGAYSVGRKYFHSVDYEGALDYAILEEEIAAYLVNETRNAFSPTMVVNFNNGKPTPEEQRLAVNSFDAKLSGSKGRKTVYSFNDNETTKTTVDAIPLNDAPSHYEYLSNESRDKILACHGVTSSMLIGITKDGQGFNSNSDEIETASVYFHNTVIKPFQDEAIAELDKILAYNNISLDLTFRSVKLLEQDMEMSVNDDATRVVSAINGMSPLVANKVIESMTPNEIRSLVGLPPASGGSDLNNTTLSAAVELKSTIDNFGEVIDESEWELIDAREVDYSLEDELDAQIELANNPNETILRKLYNLVSTGSPRTKQRSEQDTAKFLTRYRYVGSENSERDFCTAMMRAKKLYRKEDIIAMGEMKVNEGFGENGADTYSIWLYKGGPRCHHKWQRETYRRKGTDLSSPLKQKVTPAEARKEGEILPTNDKKVYTMPNDMPLKGFSPNNKNLPSDVK